MFRSALQAAKPQSIRAVLTSLQRGASTTTPARVSAPFDIRELVVKKITECIAVAGTQAAVDLGQLVKVHGPVNAQYLKDCDAAAVASFVGKSFAAEEPSTKALGLTEADNTIQTQRRISSTIWVEERVGVHTSLVIRCGETIVFTGISQPPFDPASIPAEFDQAHCTEGISRKTAINQIVYGLARSLGFDMTNMPRGFCASSLKHVRGVLIDREGREWTLFSCGIAATLKVAALHWKGYYYVTHEGVARAHDGKGPVEFPLWVSLRALPPALLRAQVSAYSVFGYCDLTTPTTAKYLDALS
eukprot:m.105214 g.105214  ORF g.105214 m.105214 type:complete len:302 (-) comp51636_c0_seq2:67-972(-)